MKLQILFFIIMLSFFSCNNAIKEDDVQLTDTSNLFENNYKEDIFGLFLYTHLKQNMDVTDIIIKSNALFEARGTLLNQNDKIFFDSCAIIGISKNIETIDIINIVSTIIKSKNEFNFLNNDEYEFWELCLIELLTINYNIDAFLTANKILLARRDLYLKSNNNELIYL